MANKASYNKAPGSKTTAVKGKKGYQSKKKVMGFDLSDTESRIAFTVFIATAVVLSALLIAGFALGFSRCGTPEVPEETEEASPAAAQTEYADMDYIAGLLENPAQTGYEYNYGNDVFRLSYDADVLALRDRFGEAGSVSLSAPGQSDKASGLTVTCFPVAAGTDPSAYLDKYTDKLSERYADYTITPEQGANAEYEGARTSQRAFTVSLPEYPVRVVVKMSVREDNAYVVQMTLGGTQSGEEIKALIDSYYSIGFSAAEQ